MKQKGFVADDQNQKFDDVGDTSTDIDVNITVPSCNLQPNTAVANSLVNYLCVEQKIELLKNVVLF